MTDTARLGELYDFFMNAPIGLHVLGADGTIEFANETDLRLAGYADAPDAYIGHRVTEFLAGSDLGEVQPYWSDGGSLVNYRASIRRRDGGLQPVVIHANARLKEGVPMGARCFTFADPAAPLRDLPAVRAVEGVVASMSEPELAALFDLLDDFFMQAPVALHIVGPDGLVRRANRLELESLGYADAPEQYIGHHIAEFHAEQPVIDDMLERLVGGKPLVHYPARLRHRNGQTVPVIIYSSPRFEEGNFVNTRCFTFPKAVDTSREVPRFSWPRDEEGAGGEDANPITGALKRLAGRKRAEESLGFLAEVSKVVASYDRAEDAANAICQLAVPFLADWCSIELGSRPLGVARGDSTGSDELIRRSAAVVPIPFTTRDGEEGVLLLARGAGAPAYGPADLALAEEVGRRIATNLELAQLRQSRTAG